MAPADPTPPGRRGDEERERPPDTTHTPIEDERRDEEEAPDHRFAADEEVADGAAGDRPARTPGQGG